VPARVFFVAFDAMDADVAEGLMRDGALPALASLASAGTTVRLTNSIDTLPDAIWTEITTGRRGSSIGWSFWRQVHAGEARMRVIRPDEIDLTAFWDHASGAGGKVAVVDVPKCAPSPGLNGLLLREWGTHDKPFLSGSEPAGFVDDVLERFGEYPLRHQEHDRSRCDDHDDSAESYRRVLHGLLEGVERKTALLRHVLDSDDWDLCAGVYSESHCVGHQFWHFQDPASPWHDPAAPDDLKGALSSVYARLDTGLGELLEGVPPDTTVAVLLSHGMNRNRGGWQLLPEVLFRLGYGGGSGLAGRTRRRLPAPVRRLARRVARGRAGERLRAAAGSHAHPLESAETRAAAMPNLPCGAIRLNVRGRDPFGSVEPGAEFDEACAELAEQLHALAHAKTGAPVVDRVLRSDELGEPVHPNIPDLLVSFSKEHPVIESVRSDRVGRIDIPVRTPQLPRSGEHLPHSLLVVRGPGIPGGARVTDGHVIDIAPTLLHLLGTPVPDALDGRPLPLSGD
jgi:predicted AlkP superfamily phosphohydrolase/phosphomutase